MASKERQTKGQINARLLNEKAQLKKEEIKLTALIKALEEQRRGVEVEQLSVQHQIKEEAQKANPETEEQSANPDIVFKVPANPPPMEEVNKTKLNLNLQSGSSVLDMMSRGVFQADHEEEEDSD